MSTSPVWQLRSRPRKRRAKFWRFDIPDLLIRHILVSDHGQRSAEDASEDHEDNTGFIDLMLRAALGGVSSDDDDGDDDEETSDGSE